RWVLVPLLGSARSAAKRNPSTSALIALSPIVPWHASRNIKFTYDPLHAISQLAANSSEIREALQNGDLRRIIQKIDGSDDPADVNILSIVSPQE
ncbi:hypothetical protein BHM03_00022895, partial [Ensete ventricosum]